MQRWPAERGVRAPSWLLPLRCAWRWLRLRGRRLRSRAFPLRGDLSVTRTGCEVETLRRLCRTGGRGCVLSQHWPGARRPSLGSGNSLGAQQPSHMSDVACGVVFGDDGMLRNSLAQVRWELGLD